MLWLWRTNKTGNKHCKYKLHAIGVSSEVSLSHDVSPTVGTAEEHTPYVRISLLKLTPDECFAQVQHPGERFFKCYFRIGIGCYTKHECCKATITLKRSVIWSLSVILRCKHLSKTLEAFTLNTLTECKNARDHLQPIQVFTPSASVE